MNRILYLISLFFTFSVSAQKLQPYGVIPSERQLKWHELDMYVLVHFTPTTFENKEWGYGDANPAIFNPKEFDANQIVSAVQSAGFKGLIIVAKHHDGFALWPTNTTDYNISKSPFRNGNGNMVKEFEQACRKAGIQFGVYCSPWDRNNKNYGTTEYVKIYREQLKELYTDFGKLFMSWHDGANGGDGYYGGAREKRTIDRSVYYGWDTTWAMTRSMQPEANIFSDMGWDVRWVGNENGQAAETSWATFTPIPEDGKTKVGPGDMKYDNSPTGTRNGKFWIPAECDVPLRPGWFYHPEHDTKVKSANELFDIYLKSVGRGACLDLGISPDTRGLLHENDVNSLKAFGQMLSQTFNHNIASSARYTSNIKTSLQNLYDDNRYSFVNPGNEKNPIFSILWNEEKEFDLIRIRENIKLGQRVEEAEIEVLKNDQWVKVAKVTSIGSNRTILIPSQKSKGLRIKITKSPVPPLISELGVFKKAN